MALARLARAKPDRAALCWLVCAGLVVAAGLSGCGKQRARVKVSGVAAGATYTITIDEPPDALDADTLKRLAERAITRGNRQLSTNKTGAQLARFNAAPAGTWVKVSARLANLVAKGLAVGHATNGAFDITARPIRRLWGLLPGAAAPKRVPSTARINAAREKTGLGLVDARRDPPSLRKRAPGVGIDLRGLARGYIVERIGKRLAAADAEHFLIEYGDDLLARGGKAGGGVWRIGLERPDGHAGNAGVVGVADAGMTTAGSYRRALAIGRRRLPRTIDPRTGRPVAHDLRAVTVIADDTVTADALAAALLVMGPTAGLAYANSHGVAALLVSGRPGHYKRARSDGFESFIQDRK